MKIISQRVWRAEQSWYYDHKFITTAGTRLWVDIRRNAYDHQSWAKGHVFDAIGKQWNLIVSIPIESCDCRKVSYVRDSVGLDDFAVDDDNIIDEMLKILGEN